MEISYLELRTLLGVIGMVSISYFITLALLAVKEVKLRSDKKLIKKDTVACHGFKNSLENILKVAERNEKLTHSERINVFKYLLEDLNTFNNVLMSKTGGGLYLEGIDELDLNVQGWQYVRIVLNEKLSKDFINPFDKWDKLEFNFAADKRFRFADFIKNVMSAVELKDFLPTIRVDLQNRLLFALEYRDLSKLNPLVVENRPLLSTLMDERK